MDDIEPYKTIKRRNMIGWGLAILIGIVTYTKHFQESLLFFALTIILGTVLVKNAADEKEKTTRLLTMVLVSILLSYVNMSGEVHRDSTIDEINQLCETDDRVYDKTFCSDIQSIVNTHKDGGNSSSDN